MMERLIRLLGPPAKTSVLVQCLCLSTSLLHLCLQRRQAARWQQHATAVCRHQAQKAALRACNLPAPRWLTQTRSWCARFTWRSMA